MDLAICFLRYGGFITGVIGFLIMALGTAYARHEYKAARHNRRRQRAAWNDFSCAVYTGGSFVAAGLASIVWSFEL